MGFSRKRARYDVIGFLKKLTRLVSSDDEKRCDVDSKMRFRQSHFYRIGLFDARMLGNIDQAKAF